MHTLLIFCGLWSISFIYNYIIYRLAYKVSLESLRLHRIRRYYFRKGNLLKRILKLNTRVYKKEYQRARAYKRIEKMKKKIKQINLDLLYLENYGEK